MDRLASGIAGRLGEWIHRCLTETGREPKAIPVTQRELDDLHREMSDMGRPLSLEQRLTGAQSPGKFWDIPLILRADAEALRSAGVWNAGTEPDSGKHARDAFTQLAATTTIETKRVPSRRIGVTCQVDERAAAYFPDVRARMWSEACRGMHLELTALVYGWKEQQPEYIAYPADWWEALKHRWAPAWALELWPIKWKVHRFTFAEWYPNVRARIPGEDAIIYMQKQPAYETYF